eukprot:5441782-Pleurochrysis_carterae.AAC.1
MEPGTTGKRSGSYTITTITTCWHADHNIRNKRSMPVEVIMLRMTPRCKVQPVHMAIVVACW